MKTDITPFSSALDIAEGIRNKAVSPVEVLDMYLNRIDRFNPGLNAIIWRNDDEARATARAAEKAVMDGDAVAPFLGVPIPIKDHQSAAGQPNTMGGSLGVSDAPRSDSELAVERLAEAGFVFTGRSNAPEMGPMGPAENRRYGITRNPWNLDFSPVGSTGGGAAALAAGLVPVAHGSDGGGSIRVPASCCGLVGLKPSRGRVPHRVPAWEHAITEGVITRFVADSAAILDAISAPDPYGWYNAPVPQRRFIDEVGREGEKLRIGLLLDAPTGVPVDDAPREAAEITARHLESLGHEIIPVAPRFYSADAIDGYLNVIINSFLYLTPYEQPELAEPYIQWRMARAKETHVGNYAQAAARIYRETRDIVSQWGKDFDVLLTPTMASRTPRVGVVIEEANQNPGAFRMTETQMISFTAFCNISGLPAISLPVHHDADGIPVGAQLVGGQWQEGVLFRLASALEGLVPWTKTSPGAYRSGID